MQAKIKKVLVGGDTAGNFNWDQHKCNGCGQPLMQKAHVYAVGNTLEVWPCDVYDCSDIDCTQVKPRPLGEKP